MKFSQTLMMYKLGWSLAGSYFLTNLAGDPGEIRYPWPFSRFSSIRLLLPMSATCRSRGVIDFEIEHQRKRHCRRARGQDGTDVSGEGTPPT